MIRAVPAAAPGSAPCPAPAAPNATAAAAGMSGRWDPVPPYAELPAATPSDLRRAEQRGPFLDALAGRKPTRRPVWWMRQAGRSLPEYRSLREGTTMNEACADPAMVAEITLQPVRRHDVDAAILFSDIVIPLTSAGVEIDIVAGVGPVVAAPVRDLAAVSALPQLEPGQVQAVTDAIGLVLRELSSEVSLIGFAGAPFTLASYLIEGGPSRHHERTKALMYAQPEVWHALMQRLSAITATFLRAQVAAGVDAIQLFDSWAGALSRSDYRRYVLPHSASVLASLASAGVPRIHFGVGTGEFLAEIGAAGAEVVGVDWRVPLDEAARRVGPGKALQGNLDPAVLFAGEDAIETHLTRIASEADRAIAAGSTGHIMNLGHGVMPATDPEAITYAVSYVHSMPVWGK